MNAASAKPRVPTGTFVRSLAYAGFEVASLAAWRDFAGTVLGLHVRAGPDDQTLLLKMDGHPYRFVLVQGPADDLIFAGWQLDDEAALERYADYLGSSGIAFEWGAPALAAHRGVARLLRVADPNGVWHEAFVGLAQSDPFVPRQTRGPFVTGAGGLGHIVFGTQHYPESVAFAQHVLGAAISDIIEQPIAPAVTAHVTFMHVNERHHSIAFAGRPGGKRLHHFMIEVENIADVGLARDRHIKSGLAVAQDIGQHSNDRMVSYYGATPSGFFVEYGWGGVKVDVATWRPGAYDRMSDWGHRPIAGAAPVAAATPASPQPASFAGDWNLLLTTPMGEQKATLHLAPDFSGTLTAMGETCAVTDAAITGGALAFKAAATRPFPMTLAFSLAFDADTLTGSVRPGPMPPAPVSGRRA